MHKLSPGDNVFEFDLVRTAGKLPLLWSASTTHISPNPGSRTLTPLMLFDAMQDGVLTFNRFLFTEIASLVSNQPPVQVSGDFGDATFNVSWFDFARTPDNPGAKPIDLGNFSGTFNAGTIDSEFVGFLRLSPVDILESLRIREITLRVAMPGDTDFDGDIDFTDVVTFGSNFEQGLTDATWYQGDFTGDHRVDFLDSVELAGNFGVSYAETIPVPEPRSLLLAVLGFAAVLLVATRAKLLVRKSPP